MSSVDQDTFFFSVLPTGPNLKFCSMYKIGSLHDVYMCPVYFRQKLQTRKRLAFATVCRNATPFRKSIMLLLGSNKIFDCLNVRPFSPARAQYV